MKRSPKFSKEAREYIKERMHEHGEMTTEEAVDLITPHLLVDPRELIHSEALRAVQRIMRNIRSENGSRLCFNLKNEDDSRYVNIETTMSIPSLNRVEKQLNNQFIGLSKSIVRVDKRRRFIQAMTGQLGMAGSPGDDKE